MVEFKSEFELIVSMLLLNIKHKTSSTSAIKVFLLNYLQRAGGAHHVFAACRLVEGHHSVLLSVWGLDTLLWQDTASSSFNIVMHSVLYFNVHKPRWRRWLTDLWWAADRRGRRARLSPALRCGAWRRRGRRWPTGSPCRWAPAPGCCGRGSAGCRWADRGRCGRALGSLRGNKGKKDREKILQRCRGHSTAEGD